MFLGRLHNEIRFMTSNYQVRGMSAKENQPKNWSNEMIFGNPVNMISKLKKEKLIEIFNYLKIYEQDRNFAFRY